MGQAQLAEVLRLLPRSANPNLLVGFETSDDAGVFRLSDTQALVQTIDFFTPIVDDPYAFGSIAAANALSDIYAMGGQPITALNVACFDPSAAPPEVWAEVLRGGFDKATEAGVLILGGHTVEDREPKFGMAVTGLVNPSEMFSNADAKVGDLIHLSKPLGTGIVTTAAKADACPAETLNAAIAQMQTLNRDAAAAAKIAGARCATDITGFGIVGHLANVAKASRVCIEIDTARLPLLPGLKGLAEAGFTTGGGARNLQHSQEFASYDQIPGWMREVISDPQTSGGLAIFTPNQISGMAQIGRVIEGPTGVRFV